MSHKGYLQRAAGVAIALLLLLTGCVAPPAEQVVPADTTAATTSSQVAQVPTYTTWDDVVAAAEGTTVNWFMWGGSDTINTHVDEKVGGPLLEQYKVTLNRVPLENTADAVNKVLNEKAAGKDSGGSIDLIWINGENFRTLKDAGLLYGPFTALLPNSQYVNWDDQAVAYDFGTAVDGYESPWASFQWVMEYNSATVEKPPQTFEELQAWVAANPGRFTYPAPPNHVGSAFVRTLFYWAAGSADPFLQEFDQAVYDQYAPKVWDYLNALKPNLWHSGETYPELAAMPDLLANGEIDFAMEYDASRASNYIDQGRYPDTIRTYVFTTGTMANVSYVAIPYNANNPAGAMVLANYLLSPEYQILLTDPTELGWLVAIDPTRLDQAQQEQLATIERGIATLPPAELNSHALPEARASWVAPIEQGWEENVLQ
ncbi:MAG: ABC transporter substrate-binding protein [Caldilineaceae bacterium]